MRAALLCLALLAAPAFAQSSATVNASGTGLRVLVDQSRSTNSSVNIDQIGIGGGSVVTQDGSGNALRLSMAGNNQEHDVRQSSAGNASIDLSSFGDRNTSSIGQDVAVGGVGTITLMQNGNGNRAELGQQVDAAGANSLALFQDGDNNYARLTQTGYGNDLSLAQQGSGLYADVTQQGSGLSLALSQSGGDAPIFITQTVMEPIGTVTK